MYQYNKIQNRIKDSNKVCSVVISKVTISSLFGLLHSQPARGYEVF